MTETPHFRLLNKLKLIHYYNFYTILETGTMQLIVLEHYLKTLLKIKGCLMFLANFLQVLKITRKFKVKNCVK